VINSIIADPCNSTREIGHGFSLSHELVRSYLHDARYQYLKPITVVGLTDVHKEKRIAIADEILAEDLYFSNIVFSDESLFYANRQTDKLWRVSGVFNQKYCTTVEHH
jgi:hypothetical protein